MRKIQKSIRFFKSACAENARKHMSPEEHDENYLGILDIKNRRCFKRSLCGNQVRIIILHVLVWWFFSFPVTMSCQQKKNFINKTYQTHGAKKHSPTILWTKQLAGSVVQSCFSGRQACLAYDYLIFMVRFRRSLIDNCVHLLTRPAMIIMLFD